ncbi:MAG: HEPN domain-containing protein [Minisyncoccales bacterium]
MNDNQDKKQIIGEWMAYAQEDENNIIALIKDKDVSPSLVCFISQQMAEKTLKALLLFYSGDYPRIHDLTQLGNLIFVYDKQINDLKECFAVLGPYYIGVRYPGNFPEGFTWEMAEEAYGAGIKIKNHCSNKIVF